MLTVRRISAPLLVVAASLSLLFASSAAAGQPSTVTVRVVGLTGTTLLPQTQVTTSSTPVDPDGNPTDLCSGTSAGGALYDAVQGNWVVKYDGVGLGYEIDGIQGLNFPSFSPSVTPDAYWSFWLNGAQATTGACGQELEPGADVVFFAQCVAIGTDCPASATAPDHFLTAFVPSSVQVGTPVSVTVGSLGTETGKAEALPGGVTVTAGSLIAAPDAQGVATFTFPSVGVYTIQAAAFDAVTSDPHIVCVHNGNDGTCGTTLPGIAKTIFNGGPEIVHLTSDVPAVSGVKNGHHYRRHKAPRILRGLVQVPAGGVLRDVLISLQRRNHGRCLVFSGSSVTFVHARCGAKRFFSVGAAESFSYLLPAALPPGHYVYDIEAIDGSRHPTKPVPGVSHVVFDVK